MTRAHITSFIAGWLSALQAQEQLAGAVEGYGVEGAELEELHSRLAAAARGQLVSHAREAANTALSRIKDR